MAKCGEKQPSESTIFNPDLHVEPSIYIPFVFPNVMNRDGFIKKTIEELGLGTVASVCESMMKHANGKSYYRVFVHMKSWATNENACKVRQRLMSGDQVKINYEDPWFWFFKKVDINFNIKGSSVRPNPYVYHPIKHDNRMSGMPLLKSEMTPKESLAISRASRKSKEVAAPAPEPAPAPAPEPVRHAKYVSPRPGAWKGWSDISHLSPEEQEEIEDFRESKELGWLGI